MSSSHRARVVGGDGSGRDFDLPAPATGPAPAWVPAALGLPADPGWVLLPAGVTTGGLPRVLLARPVRAAADDPRQARLRREWDLLQQLNRESDTVRAEVLEAAGGVPQVYRFRFFCKGILGKDASGAPRYGTEHSCKVTLTAQYPARAPQLQWETEIWHPNIHHQTRDVCVQDVEWLAAHTLVDLCRMLFEMVQYKNYHAKSEPPYPKDSDVAQWVREIAEPRGYVNKARRIFVDDQPFTRPLGNSPPPLPPPPKPKITLVKTTPGAAGPAPSPTTGPIRINPRTS